MAVPDSDPCRACRQLNGKSISLDELKREGHRYSCRCGIVLPADDEE
jgi:hypothetical protein